MQRTLAVATALFVLALAVPRGAGAFGVKDVIAMHRGGIADSLVVMKIEHGGTRFDLEARDFRDLKAAGVSDDVVVAMLRTEDDQRAPIEYDGRYWPYDPRWSVALDLGWYGAYRHVYAPYVGAYGRFGGPRPGRYGRYRYR